MEELKPAEILKAVHTCGSSFCTTDRHECPYGDEGCIDCVDRLEADFEALIIAGDDLIIRRAEPEIKALTLEHVDCKTCQFEDRDPDEEPCRHCKGAYPSRYARRPEGSITP